MAEKKPNVLFISADDSGYADLSVYGRKDYSTPCSDSLAKDGSQSTNGYSNSPVCSATRVSILTGQYQYRYPLGLHEPVFNNVFAKVDDPNSPKERAKRFVPLPTDLNTLPRDFKKRGYSTHLVGKWHLGTLPHNGPRQYGYDSFFGFLGGATDYFKHRMFLEEELPEDSLVLNDEFVQREGYLTHSLGDEAEKIISDNSGHNEKPWLLSSHFNAPHWPWEGPDDEERSKDIKDLIGLEGNIRKYGEIVQSMDGQIGSIIKVLKATNQYDNTIIVFTSDNGGERFSDNWPFLGVKTELLEGGLRVPLIIGWERGMSLSQKGKKNSQVVTSMDLYPTLLGLVDGEIRNYDYLDGENLSSVFTGIADERTRKIFWRYKAYAQEAVRHGPWKYLKIGNHEYLFNLEKDERERTDYKEANPEIFEQLKRDWYVWNKTMLQYPDGWPSYHIRNFPGFPDRY